MCRDLLSYPAMRTNHYNINGSDKFRSKVQFVVCFPTVLAIICVVMIYGIPLLSNDIFTTEVSFTKVDFGLDGIRNSSNYDYYPVGGIYTKFLKFWGVKLGVDVGLVKPKELF